MTAEDASPAPRRTAPRPGGPACPAGAPWSGPPPRPGPPPGGTRESASHPARRCGTPCRGTRCTEAGHARASTGPEPVRCGYAGPGRHLGVDEEGVLHLTRRMVGAQVQGVEVEPLGLDLGPLCDLPAHGDKDVAHPFGGQLEGVTRADPAAGHRRRDVDRPVPYT